LRDRAFFQNMAYVSGKAERIFVNIYHGYIFGQESPSFLCWIVKTRAHDCSISIRGRLLDKDWGRNCRPNCRLLPPPPFYEIREGVAKCLGQYLGELSALEICVSHMLDRGVHPPTAMTQPFSLSFPFLPLPLSFPHLLPFPSFPYSPFTSPLPCPSFLFFLPLEVGPLNPGSLPDHCKLPQCLGQYLGELSALEICVSEVLLLDVAKYLNKFTSSAQDL